MSEGTIVYRPTPEQAARANVKRFMDRHRMPTLEALVERSQKDVEWFWGAVERDLGVVWSKPYDKVLDASKGIPWARWFVGGKTNLSANCVDRWRAAAPSRSAVVWEGEDGAVRSLTYEELGRLVDGIAGALVDRGIRLGDAVAVLMPMTPECVASMLAIAKIGAIFIPLFSGFGVEAVETRLRDAEARAILVADGFYRRGQVVPLKPVADEAAARVGSVRTVFVHRRLGPAAGTLSWAAGRDVDLEEATRAVRSPPPTRAMDSEDPFMVVYTSGTTGRPKGAVHVHGGFLVKIMQEGAHQTDVHPDDVLFWFTDMGWIMGPWEVVATLGNGATLFLYEGAPDYPGPDRLWSLVARHKITILGIGPTLVRALMKSGTAPVRRHDLSSLRVLASTGEPWNPEPWMWLFSEIGGGRCPIINLSGGTEVGACFLSPTPITPLKPTSLGHPSLGMAIDVYDEHGKPVRGAVGELVCTKPWPGMTRGLWKAPERYLEVYWSRWKDVWVHGDWASIDADGSWFLHGRSDDTIKIAGKRLGPAEIESILVDTGKVVEAAAVGVPHEVKGEALWCYAVLRPDVPATDETRKVLVAAVDASLGKSFRPERIFFVSTLPKTRNAKILRRAVRAVATGKPAGDLSNLENPAALDEIAKVTKG
ncbi:MAG: AMP-binding protein [Methanobacteriota archaeon]